MRLALKLALTMAGVLLVLALVMLLLSSFKFDASIPGSRAVIAPAPDPRYEWEHFPVDGLLLCRPGADSTQMNCLSLPKGSFLLIRVEVPPGTPAPGDVGSR